MPTFVSYVTGILIVVFLVLAIMNAAVSLILMWSTVEVDRQRAPALMQLSIFIVLVLILLTN